eukprot:526826_1
MILSCIKQLYIRILFLPKKYVRAGVKGYSNMDHALIMMDSSIYGIQNESAISFTHLLSIIIYCSYDTLSFKFSETFRKRNDENYKQLKSRHSNFYHLSKYLNEAVHVFGKCMFNDKNNIHSFFHGISENHMFDSMSAFIYGPFSTTASFEVSVNFTNHNNGIVLELNPFKILRYFDCSWVSDFSNEREFLFISMNTPIRFINIINANLQIEYFIYTNAITIIDNMMNGWYFESDFKVFEKYKYYKNIGMQRSNTLSLGAKPISDIQKLNVVRLIKNELGMNGKSGVDQYITALFHNICTKRLRMRIDMQTMFCEISKQYVFLQGYNGYLFLKNFFFEPNSEIIKFKIINNLYKNLENIGIENLSNISAAYLDKILIHLSILNTSSKIKSILLTLKKGIVIDLQTLIKSYKSKFMSIGYGMREDMSRFKSNGEERQALSISKNGLTLWNSLQHIMKGSNDLNIFDVIHLTSNRLRTNGCNDDSNDEQQIANTLWQRMDELRPHELDRKIAIMRTKMTETNDIDLCFQEMVKLISADPEFITLFKEFVKTCSNPDVL